MSAGTAGVGGVAGAGVVVRQGHLRKLKTMRKKYFVLRAQTPDCSARLEYYESEKKFRSGAVARRMLPLKSCYNITRRLDLKQKHVIALFTREEQFCVVAENEAELHGWLTDILKQHGSDDASEELLHPIQHVWQVNVQKKGLGASKNIQGLYNLCLTDKTLTLVKIKSHNNVISDLGIPERVEYSLKNIRRCGDSECFFYMEVGRQTSTGAGELWMHSCDSNIAQSMHSTIYLAMKNCAKMSENERDHIILPSNASLDGPNPRPPRRQTYSDGSGRAGLANEKGLCVGSCIRQCVCPTATYSVDDSAAAIAPLTPKNAENQPPNNSLITDKPETARVIKHHRTVSLPTGCTLFQEPLKIVHERTRCPLTGDEVDRVTAPAIERSAAHSSCKAVDGSDAGPARPQWARRASTGARVAKRSPGHAKNAGTLRNRCDSMPSRACASFEPERPQPRHNDLIEGLDMSRDETDALVEWYRTPRIPEEPDCCDISKDIISALAVQHSRTSSLGVEDGYLAMAPHEPPAGLVSASSGSVCSGTPSTDPRFSEYQLEPATALLLQERPPRAYSVGSRAALRAEPRHRAYSVGARCRPPPRPPQPASAPLLPRASAEDLMELDFSANSPAAKVVVARTPPASIGFGELRNRTTVDEYVDMSPRNAGYVEMRPGDAPALPHPAAVPALPLTPLTPAALLTPTVTMSPAATPDGYVEMNYTRAPTRPITIAARVPAVPLSVSPPEEARRRRERERERERERDREQEREREPRTPLGSQMLFPLSPDLPASIPDLDAADIFEDDARDDLTLQHLSTVREMSEECGRRSPAGADEPVSQSPQYVRLVHSRPLAAAPPRDVARNPAADKSLPRRPHAPTQESNNTATLVVAGTGGGAPARFVLRESPSPPPSPGARAPRGAPLTYAALDLEPRRGPAAGPRTYTQIDFLRSEKLHAADGT
ncbi:LOW QUALITY PROTEIN: uncharacterized protein ACR2FA_009019 [Aphomia sociella]